MALGLLYFQRVGFRRILKLSGKPAHFRSRYGNGKRNRAPLGIGSDVSGCILIRLNIR